MKKLFGLFVIGILSSTAMAELVCLSPSGCVIELETGACPTCVAIVKPIVEPFANIKKDLLEAGESEIVRTSNSGCLSYFEREHGGKNYCEVDDKLCRELRKKAGTRVSRCDESYKTCKKSEKEHNWRFTKNHGKITCG